MTSTILHRLNPLEVIEQLVHAQAEGCLQFTSGTTQWQLWFAQGYLVYATHSIDPFERLEQHLRRLSSQVPGLTSQLRTQVRLRFEDSQIGADYAAICWLVEQEYLNPSAATQLIAGLIQEVVEAYLLLDQGDYRFIGTIDQTLPIFCRLKVSTVVATCQQRLRSWQMMLPQVYSPYQRPYFSSQVQAQQKLSAEQRQKLSQILRGFSFRQLAVLLNQDELRLAQTLHTYIADGVILLRDPQAPFDKLPVLDNGLAVQPAVLSSPAHMSLFDRSTTDELAPTLAQKQYTIACVDDSPAVLQEINRFLKNEDFAVYAINDPLKALMEVIRLKPDLILLDVGMPLMDGYKLCRLIRNHSLFKVTPIVMVTGNTGLIDRAKAKLVGATDYMTKPFTQPELLKMVFRYLT